MARELLQKPKNGYIILMVDDDIQILNTYVPILESEGYTVLSTARGEDTVNILKNNHVDVMILDYFMNGINGEQVISSVREFYKDLIIILQTGYSGKIPALEMLNKLDVQSYFNKADGTERLLLTVASAIKYLKQRNSTNWI